MSDSALRHLMLTGEMIGADERDTAIQVPQLDGTFKLNGGTLFESNFVDLHLFFFMMQLLEFQITSQCTSTANRDCS